MTEINFKEIVAQVKSQNTDIRPQDVERIARATISSIVSNVAVHRRVEINKFGTLKVVNRKQRSGTAPNGAAWVKPAYQQITFNAAPAFEEAVSAETGYDVE